MRFCSECGSELILKDHGPEGMIPFCPTCGKFRHPGYNTAVSMVVLNPAKDRVLLIRQYGRPSYILVAGYVNRGEDAEDAVAREIREELGAEVAEVRFNRSRFFPPSNTLMLNFTAVLSGETLRPNEEIDSYAWFSVEEAKQSIRAGSLAEAFLRGYFDGNYIWPDYSN